MSQLWRADGTSGLLTVDASLFQEQRLYRAILGTRNVAVAGPLAYRRSQDFVCGGALFCQKKLTTFFSRRRLNLPPNLSHPAKN